MGGRGSKKFTGALVRAPNQKKQGVTFPADNRRPTSNKDATAVEAAHNRMMQKNEAWAQSLNAQEKDAIQSYQGSAYVKMNQQLRDAGANGGDSSFITSWTSTDIRDATSALDKASLPESVVTWRRSGLYKTYADAQALVGQKETDYGFTSTSLSKTYALNSQITYGATNTADPLPLVYRFHIPKGANAAYVEASTKSGPYGYQGEHEVLIQRNSEYRITKATIATGTDAYGQARYALILDATYIGSPKDARIKLPGQK